MDLLLATRNAHKTREFASILGKEYRLSDLTDYDEFHAIAETGQTFAQNAMIKANSISSQLMAPGRGFGQAKAPPASTLVIADDSGLEVDSLGPTPGVFSARYAGEHATDRQNIDKLLAALENETRRDARFRCVIALAKAGQLVQTFEGVIEGKIVHVARGTGGFGYDPVFQPNGFDKTFAELPAETKNEISHRARAIRALLQFLAKE
jgi:XTP/dITP diphosphohydrolase